MLLTCVLNFELGFVFSCYAYNVPHMKIDILFLWKLEVPYSAHQSAVQCKKFIESVIISSNAEK